MTPEGPPAARLEAADGTGVPVPLPVKPQGVLLRAELCPCRASAAPEETGPHEHPQTLLSEEESLSCCCVCPPGNAAGPGSVGGRSLLASLSASLLKPGIYSSFGMSGIKAFGHSLNFQIQRKTASGGSAK